MRPEIFVWFCQSNDNRVKKTRFYDCNTGERMRKTGDMQVLPNVVGCDYVWTMIMMRRMRRRRRPMNMYTLRHTEYIL